MRYYSFETALYQRFVGKQIRVVKEILLIAVFHRQKRDHISSRFFLRN